MGVNLTLEPDGHCYSAEMPSFLERWDQAAYDHLVYERNCNCSQIAYDNDMVNLQCDSAIGHSWWVESVYILMFSIIIVIGCAGNSIVIWIVLAHRRMRTVTNYFLLNLAVSDLSICIFNVCFSFTYNLYFNWFFGDTYCHINSFMGVVPTCSSVLTLMCMSLDRYMAIVHPLRPRLSRRKTLACIASIWLLAICSGIPSLIYAQTSHFFFQHNLVVTCTVRFPSVLVEEIHNHLLLVLMYLLPLVVLSFTYSLVAKALWGSQPIGVGDSKQEESIKTKRRVVKMMMVVVTLFLVCWLPYHLYFAVLIYKLANYFSNIVILHIYLNMYWLAMSSTVVNPIIYCYMNNRFRTGFMYALRWIPCVPMNKAIYTDSELCGDPRRYSHSTYMSRSRLNRNPIYSGPRASQIRERLRQNRSDAEYDSTFYGSEPPSCKHSLCYLPANGEIQVDARRTKSVVVNHATVIENIQVTNEFMDGIELEPARVMSKNLVETTNMTEYMPLKVSYTCGDVASPDVNENIPNIDDDNQADAADNLLDTSTSNSVEETSFTRNIRKPVSISMHELTAQTTDECSPKCSRRSNVRRINQIATFKSTVFSADQKFKVVNEWPTSSQLSVLRMRSFVGQSCERGLPKVLTEWAHGSDVSESKVLIRTADKLVNGVVTPRLAVREGNKTVKELSQAAS